MKEFSIELNTLSDLLRLQVLIRRYGLHGQIRQMNFVSNIRFGPYLALALPLDSATLQLRDCAPNAEAALRPLCAANA